MKKLFCIIGAFVSLAAVFATAAVLLKKLKISLSIEGIDDSIVDDNDNPDIDLSIEDEEPNFDETEEVVEAALDEMLDEDDEKEIEVEISEL